MAQQVKASVDAGDVTKRADLSLAHTRTKEAFHTFQIKHTLLTFIYILKAFLLPSAYFHLFLF